MHRVYTILSIKLILGAKLDCERLNISHKSNRRSTNITKKQVLFKKNKTCKIKIFRKRHKNYYNTISDKHKTSKCIKITKSYNRTKVRL